MNEVKIIVEKKEHVLKLASCWDEFSQEEMLLIIPQLPYLMSGELCDELFSKLTAIDKKKYHELSANQRYAITELFDFLRVEPVMKRLIVESFALKGVEYIGYQSGFGNITWEEFITAERYFMQNNYTVAAAVLYRQRRANYTGEHDPRTPFTVYGTETRAELFKKLDPSITAAIALNYSCLRAAYIVKKYRYVFPYGGSGSNEGTKAFSWINVTRTILGDSFFEEKKILKSNVHTVLHRMNYLMDPERRKRKK